MATGNRNILDFLNKLPGPSPDGGASGAGPSSLPLPVPGMRKVDDSPADRRQLLAEAAQRRMQQQQAAVQAPDQAPAGAGSIQGSARGANAVAEPGGGSSRGNAGRMHGGGSGAGALVKEESGGSSRGDEAILLDSDEEEQQMPAAECSTPVSALARSDSTEAHATALLSGGAEGGRGAGRGFGQGAAEAAAGGCRDAMVCCPICEQRWRLEDMPNAQLNAHIDQCLLG